MKKLLFLFAFLMACNFTMGQSQQKVYCQLVGQGKMFSSKVNVIVDFGQNRMQNNKLVDENGKNIVFNSMVDAMNFMGSLGWEFEQAYVVTMGSGASGQNVYHWLLSKYISENESLNEGLKTKAEFNQETKAQ